MIQCLFPAGADCYWQGMGVAPATHPTEAFRSSDSVAVGANQRRTAFVLKHSRDAAGIRRRRFRRAPGRFRGVRDEGGDWVKQTRLCRPTGAVHSRGCRRCSAAGDVID